MHSASSSSCISLNGSSYTHAAIGGELLPACVGHRPRAMLNHYAYQSQAAWAAKKRGNVLGRKGAVPEIYEKVHDDTGVELLSERIRRAHAATPRYGQCLGALFFGRGDS